MSDWVGRYLYASCRVRRSLPERTVDAWVCAYIVQRFPNALVWAPTQRELGSNWDMGAALGNGKVFILENKATTAVSRTREQPLETHKIDIDLDQLDWYCDEVDKLVETYYVLPSPPWRGKPDLELVPSEAVFRTGLVRESFESWAWVVRSRDLRRHLAGESRLETHRLPMHEAESLEDFLTEMQNCRRGTRIVGEGRRLVRYLKSSELEEGQEAMPQPSNADRGDLDTRVGSAIAMFVRDQDLTHT